MGSRLAVVCFASAGLAYALSGSNSSVVWSSCDPAIVQNPLLSCAYFNVPLDYRDLSAGNARLALAKVNATASASARLGTLFFNPGGPHISGIESLSDNVQLLLGLSGGLYDVVSWDPRGVGPLTFPGDIFCFSSPEEENSFFAGTLQDTGIEYTGNFTDSKDIKSLLNKAPEAQTLYEDLGKKCLEHDEGRLLKYVGSTATARDIISMADALEGPDKPVNYVGISYGTLIGSLFINMFPQRVGRVVLDGVLDPNFFSTEDLSLHWSNQLVDADSVYKALITGCALTGPAGCGMASQNDGPLDVDAAVQEILTAAHDAVQRSQDGSNLLTSGQIRSALYNQVSDPIGWANFTNQDWLEIVGNVSAESGSDVVNGSIHARSSEFRMRSRSLRARNENQTDPFSTEAIMCGDSVDAHHPSMKPVFENLIAASQNVSHLFGAQWPEPAYACAFWPARAVERYQGPFNKTLANPILVLSNLFDPITPIAGARSVVDMLGDSARLVTQNGIGHTTNSDPSTCLAEVIIAYIANGTLPENNDMTCDVDADFEIFPGVNTEMILSNLPGSGV